MTEIIAPSLYFLAGICAYAGFLHLYAGMRRPTDRSKLLFAIISLLLLPQVTLLVQNLKAHDLKEFVFYLKWSVSFSIIIFLELVWFFALFTQKYSKTFLSAIFLFSVVLLVMNYLAPYGLQFHEITSLKTVVLPWGESISLALGPINKWYFGVILVVLMSFGYFFYALIAYYRETNKRHILGMVYAVAFFIACLIQSVLVRLSIVDFMYLGPYGFLGLVFVMSVILDYDYHQNLREKDEKLRGLYELSPLGIALTDMQGRYIEFNKAFSHICGYPANELSNLDYWSLTPKIYESQEALQLESLESTGFYGPYEKEYRKKNGELIPIRLNGMLINGTDGQRYIWSIVEDITLWKQTQEALTKSEKRYRIIVETTSEGICLIDQFFQMSFVNSAMARMLGYTPEQMLGRPMEDFILEDEILVYKQHMKLRMQGKSSHYEQRMRHKDGSARWCSVTNTPLHDTQGNFSGTIAMIRDISEQKHAEKEMRLAALVYRASSQAMMVTDADNRIITVNPAFTEITGYRLEDVLGKESKLLHSDRHESAFYAAMRESIASTGKWHGEIWSRRKNGEIFPELLTVDTIYRDDGLVYRRIALFTDITEEKKNEELIWRQANYDSLTDLPNRRMMQDRLQEELKKSRRNKKSLALLFIDLDRFKEINDTLGHDSGDNLLKQAAKRMTACIRETDAVGRLGGDEFIVVLNNLDDASSVGAIANNLLVDLAKPYLLGNELTHISASIGITIYPDDADDVSTLLKNADQAMYAAKQQGRNCFHYYTSAMQEAANYRMRITNHLHGALANDQFRLHYQPIVELATGSIYKAEALIRWQHPVMGLISPAIFIPIAEDTGQIVAIGDWVFRQAIAQVIELRANYHPEFQISVNKSPVQFKANDERHKLWLDHLTDVGLSAQGIIVEITEGLLMEVSEEISSQLLAFKDYGIQIALDDFGTGYSSLSYLKKFDIDYIKIDKSFVSNLSLGSNDMTLCEAIIEMAHKLQLKVIAEGVETQDQCDLLQQLGCDYAQGYLFSKPLPSDEFESMLSSRATRAVI
ncbi:MAG: EAL domain-containing protein [Methylobacter sp.]